jgi:hypothetical protein
MDDNMFDEDDALDYILFEEHTNSEKQNPPNADCLGVILFFIISSTSLCFCLGNYM